MADSITDLRLDVVTAKALVWLVSLGREADLTSEAHIFFFDRYQRLAAYHRQRGRAARARQLQAKADEHYELGGGEGPPYAAAMGMPRPRRWLSVDAVGRSQFRGPDDAA